MGKERRVANLERRGKGGRPLSSRGVQGGARGRLGRDAIKWFWNWVVLYIKRVDVITS